MLGSRTICADACGSTLLLLTGHAAEGEQQPRGLSRAGILLVSLRLAKPIRVIIVGAGYHITSAAETNINNAALVLHEALKTCETGPFAQPQAS